MRGNGHGGKRSVIEILPHLKICLVSRTEQQDDEVVTEAGIINELIYCLILINTYHHHISFPI